MLPANFTSDKIALESESAEWRNPTARRIHARRPAGGAQRTGPNAARALPSTILRTFRNATARSTRKANYPVRYSKQLEKMLEKVRRRVSRAALK